MRSRTQIEYYFLIDYGFYLPFDLPMTTITMITTRKPPMTPIMSMGSIGNEVPEPVPVLVVVVFVSEVVVSVTVCACSEYFDVPGLEADTEHIIYRIADIDVAEIDKPFKLVRSGKILGEVFLSPSRNADIEIADAVKGVPRRCQRS